MPAKRNIDRRAFVTFEGLGDFLKDLGVAESELADAEGLFKTLAAHTVVDTAQARARSVGRQQALASQDVKVVRRIKTRELNYG
jgi:hypothetical protein